MLSERFLDVIPTRALFAKLFVAGAVASLAVALMAAGCRRDERATDAPSAKVHRPDIVFILIDTLRADRLGCYGCKRGANSPVIDSIAREGVLFEKVITASPWTQPSMASIFASVYPGVHKVLSYPQAVQAVYGGAEKVMVFQESFVTLAEVLKQAGYATAGFVANPFILEDFGFAQGFDHFDSSFAKIAAPGSLVNEAFTSWLEENLSTKPLFLYLHYMDVHGPYDAQPHFIDPLLDEVEHAPVLTQLSKRDLERMKYLLTVPTEVTNAARHERLSAFREYWLARYDAATRQVDHFIGQVRDRLREAGRWDDALIVIASDHGEAFGEHGFWEHGYSMHHTDLHVPLILRGGRTLAAGLRIDGWVRLIDLMPTILDVVGLEPPGGVQGVSLLGAIQERDAGGLSPAFSEGIIRGPEQQALYAGGWKLIAKPSNGARTLYHIVEDVAEEVDLAADRPEHVGTLGKLLETQLEENENRARGITPQSRNLTPEQIKRLKALGYLGD